MKETNEDFPLNEPHYHTNKHGAHNSNGDNFETGHSLSRPNRKPVLPKPQTNKQVKLRQFNYTIESNQKNGPIKKCVQQTKRLTSVGSPRFNSLSLIIFLMEIRHLFSRIIFT